MKAPIGSTEVSSKIVFRKLAAGVRGGGGRITGFAGGGGMVFVLMDRKTVVPLGEVSSRITAEGLGVLMVTSTRVAVPVGLARLPPGGCVTNDSVMVNALLPLNSVSARTGTVMVWLLALVKVSTPVVVV